MTNVYLTLNDQMEALSRAYVAAVAAHAGYGTSEPTPDRDSIDVVLHASGDFRPKIEVQLKATTGAPADGSNFSFDLSIKNYNDLRIKTQTPRILIVLAVPKDFNDWLE